MHPVVRNTLAVIVGVAVAFALIAGIESVGHMIYPVVEGVDVADLAQIRGLIAQLPLGALLMVLVAWVTGAFGGGLAASFVAGAKPMLWSAVIGALVLAATVANLLMIPHPTWFAAAGIVGIVAGTFAAGKLAAAWITQRR